MREERIRKREANHLLELLDLAFDKRSWHGANLMSAIRGVHAEQARKSILGRKTIWEQLLHAAYWKSVVIAKISGAKAWERKGSNWVKMPSPGNEKKWKADVEMVRALQRRLRVVVEQRGKQLSQKEAWLVQGAAFHDIYHAGQIKLLRRIMK
jgi:hypothetical protein